MLALNQKQVTLKLKEHLENTTNTLESLQPGTYNDHGPYLANKNVWEMSEVAVKGNDSGGTVDGSAGWGSWKDKTQRICVCVFVELSRGGRGCESRSKHWDWIQPRRLLIHTAITIPGPTYSL